MTVTAYLAGPDVFLPNADEHAARKVAICQRFGFRGLPPLKQDVETAANELKAWQAIFEKDVAMMERSDIIVANLTPFGGASADAGTLIEVGCFSAGASRSSAIRTPVIILNPASADNWAMTMPS
jgi:nucleoside 2-deoxyribosyltransferase